ncbi:hypothetical protein RCL_jg11983.t1 [Rhizophagus clarus]|uniref:Uncharacterized protein n=1 Tax=Rhizophagus clarus TaxID=94130 RepID=A0A8H3L4L1_9GLOM|nr:hypothetical protein RCL_jg11983.t1 [Rhizophagus clarus]
MHPRTIFKIFIHTHFTFNRSLPGPCVIEIDDIKPGKRLSIARAVFKQPNSRYSNICDLNRERGISSLLFDVTPMANKSNCEFLVPPEITTLSNHVKVYLDIPTKNLKRAEIKQWSKFNDNRTLDIISLGYNGKEVLKGETFDLGL